MTELSVNYLDIDAEDIYSARIGIENGKISSIIPIEGDDTLPFLFPGFIDSHIHIESSMLAPSRFAQEALKHGTVATVSDPHEIANVLGIPGIEFMIEDGKRVPFNFYFGAPSCVPATSDAFETAGANLGPKDIEDLLDQPEILYLSEMMNFPGAIQGQKDVLQKIDSALQRGKPVDGHAPGLRGKALETYVGRGISTDHETITYEEGVEKIKLGMKVSIREGSAARNFDDLVKLIDEHPEMVMFCSDDLHPDGLILGHINLLVKRAVEKGCSFWNVIRAACKNPVLHYQLDCGYGRVGDPANFFLSEDLDEIIPTDVWCKGEKVIETGKSLFSLKEIRSLNRFELQDLTADSLRFPVETGDRLKVIRALDGQLVTEAVSMIIDRDMRNFESDAEHDIMKILVADRYGKGNHTVGFVQGFGLRDCAIFSSIGHDSHNVVILGSHDALIIQAYEKIGELKGGIGFVSPKKAAALPLPIAGLMSTDECRTVAENYTRLNKDLGDLGGKMSSPFMTLSFLPLLVIPSLKISDKGLFDVDDFSFTPVIDLGG